METVCYDIITLNRKKLVFKKCLYCQSDLKTRQVDHSEASRAFTQTAAKPVISTHLTECPYCGWWAVRELREDNALYSPPVEEFIVMDASKTVSAKPAPRGMLPQNAPAPWEQVLTNKAYWAKSEPIPSRHAVELFGTAQMLLPKGPSREAVLDRLKSYAPVLYPILIIIFIALFF